MGGSDGWKSIHPFKSMYASYIQIHFDNKDRWH